MNCEDIHPLLSLYVMDDLMEEDKEMVERHISDCSDCLGEVRILRDVIENVAAVEVSDPGEEFWNHFETSLMRQVDLLEGKKSLSILHLVRGIFPSLEDLGFTRALGYAACILCVAFLAGLFTWKAHLRYSNPFEGFSPALLSYRNVVEENVPYTDYLDSMTDEELAAVSEVVTGWGVEVPGESEDVLLEYERQGTYNIYAEIDQMGDEELDQLMKAIDQLQNS